MNRIILTTCTLLTLLIGSCSLKTEEFLESETPVFYLTGTNQNDPIDIRAGQDGYYMFTNSPTADLMYRSFEGTFAQADCPSLDCPETWAFQIKQFQLDTQNSTANTLAGPQPYFIQLEKTDGVVLYNARFQAENKVYDSIHWQLQTTEFKGEATMSTTFVGDPFTEVGLITFKNNIVSSYIQTIEFPYLDSACGDIRLIATVDNSFVYLNANVTTANSSPQYATTWNNGTISSLESVMPYSKDSTYELIVANLSQFGSTCRTRVSFKNLPDSGTYESSSFTTEIAPQEAAQQSGVTIIWHDAQGQVWSSVLRPQWNDYFFNVNSVESYKTNENNVSTLQLRIGYKCQLFNAAQPDRSRWVEGEGVIGVGQ